MEINEKLSRLYKSKYIELSKQIIEYNNKLLFKNRKDLCATNPLMLKIDEDWEKSDLKIMIFGQETNGWANEAGNEGLFCSKVEEVIKVYEDFYLQNTMYNSPFWNEFRRVKRNLNIEDRKVSVLWNNIIKIGRNGIGNVEEINIISKKYFDVIKDEIEILKPNILIFFTGPNYDDKIQTFLGEFTIKSIEGFELDKFCEFVFKDNFKLEKVMRTYHPQYLYRNKMRKTFIDRLITEINH